MKSKATLWWMVVVLLVATVLRLAYFGQVPPGLYHDETQHGLDALELLQGHFPIYFPANNGREPMFIYLVALAVGLLGRSPFALRFFASPIGLLTIAATFAMGRKLFSRRVGLLSAAVLAVMLWHVHLSRVGFRAVLLPLMIALSGWQAAMGIRTVRRKHWLLAGVFYGLSFYTYTAARFTPLGLAAFGLYLLAARRRVSVSVSSGGGDVKEQLWRRLGLAAMVALVTVLPLAAYTVGHVEVVLGRPGQVSVFNPLIHRGDPGGTLMAQALRTLGMFFVRGDRIWRHNVPWRPVFDPVLGVAFALGVLVAACRARRDPAMGFTVIWTAVMAIPTVLAEDAPHFLRSVGILPVLAFFPALGLDWVVDRLQGPSQPWARAWRGLRLALLVLPVSFGLGSTAWAYFGDYAHNKTTGFWFERGAVALTGRINEFLGVGWDGQRMVRGGPGDRRVVIDRALWNQWPQVPFLLAAPKSVSIGLPEESPSAGSEPVFLGEQEAGVAVFVWPYGDWKRARAAFPAPAEVYVEKGPLSQGDLDPAPFTTYTAFFAVPPDPNHELLARFSGGVELLSVEVSAAGEAHISFASAEVEGLKVRLRWRATAPLAEDYTIFLHYIRDGERLAQVDERPCSGHYPTTAWRPGDVINDDHFIAAITSSRPDLDLLRVGFYQRETEAVLHLLDEMGNPASEWIDIPVEG